MKSKISIIKKLFYENWAKNGQNPLYFGSKLKMGGHRPRMVRLSWNFFGGYLGAYTAIAKKFFSGQANIPLPLKLSYYLSQIKSGWEL